MQAPQQSYRGVQRSPRPGTAVYMQGKKQTALSMQRYHILCAALQKKYAICDITPIVPTADKCSDEGLDAGPESDIDSDAGSDADSDNSPHLVRGTIDFSAYKEFKLHPIKDVELPEPELDGSANWRSLSRWGMANETDWKLREGGVLYALAEYGKFFNCILQYHTCGKTGVGHWNTLFSTLQTSEYRKNSIPCMFFGRQGGCSDQNCPFLHDRDAVLADRKQIIEQRREKIERYKHRPTYRQSIFREVYVLAAMAGDNKTLRAEIEKSGVVEKDLRNDRAYCANMNCLKPWKKGMENPLKACKRCKFTMYCSPKCQKEDWPRHKKDPCASIAETVENDDIWNPLGIRKGTAFVKTHDDLEGGSGRRGFHMDA